MITLFALIIIAALLLVLFAINMDEAKRLLAAQSLEFCQSYITIKKVRLNAKDLSMDDPQSDPLPEAMYFLAAAIMALLCSFAGLPVSTLFFLVCFACCFADFLEQLKDIQIVQYWNTGRGFTTEAVA